MAAPRKEGGMTTAPTPVPQRHGHPRPLTLALLAVGAALLAIVIVLLVRGNGSTSVSVGILGSGVSVSQTRPLAAFHSIDLAGSSNVTVQVGRPQSVTVHADDNLVGIVTTVVTGGRLVVGNVGSFTTKAPMQVEISVRSLDGVSLTGSGTVAVSGVDAKTFTVDLRGSGVITAGGAVRTLHATLGGSGDCRLSQLKARDAEAVLTGSGRLSVTASRSLDASMTGTGEIVYGGNPAHVTRNVTGTGTISEAQ
jgi:hypothetical protein